MADSKPTETATEGKAAAPCCTRCGGTTYSYRRETIANVEGGRDCQTCGGIFSWSPNVRGADSRSTPAGGRVARVLGRVRRSRSRDPDCPGTPGRRGAGGVRLADARRRNHRPPRQDPGPGAA